MVIIKKEELNRSYTIFTGGDIDIKSYCVQMVLHHLLDSLLNSYLYTVDNVQTWSCEHTGKIGLKDYCETHELDCEKLKWIWQGILETLLEAEEFLLDVDSLYLKESEIYLDDNECTVSVCYVPFEKMSVWKQLLELAQFMLGYLNQCDGKAVQMAYGIFRYLSQGGSNIDEMWQLTQELEYESKESDTGGGIDGFLDTEEDRDYESKRKFSVWRWILSGLSIAMAVFFIGYAMLNEWYLSNRQKILLIITVVIFGATGILLWYKWRHLFTKEKFYDEDSNEELIDMGDRIPRLVRKDNKAELFIPQIPSIIGKLPDAVQILISEPTVSRIHAQIFMDEGVYYIEDMNSTNGTYLNGKRLEAKKPARLEGNDELTFADIPFYFQLSNR